MLLRPPPRSLTASSGSAAALRWSLAVGLMGALSVGSAACTDDEPVALTGEREGTVRYIVYLDLEAPDLTEYKKALASGDDVDDAVEALRVAARKKARPFKKALRESLDGRVIDYWFLRPAVTVELKVGNVPNLETLPGVKRIEPDRLFTGQAAE